jgi:hypothetical protein
MRQNSSPCPICNNLIRPLDSTRNLTFNSRAEVLHNRCWYENQELIAMLEAKEAETPLAEMIKKARENPS